MSPPGWGPKRLSLQLERDGIFVSPSTIWRALHRLALGTRTEQLLVLSYFGGRMHYFGI